MQENPLPDEPKRSSPKDLEKKPWRTLKLKVLDVPRDTKGGGAGRVDPVEDFGLYRLS